MNNNETFHPENKTIFSLLACDAIYTVPNYQRQYSWDDEKLSDLWNDLFDSFKNDPSENYFLGSVVVIDDGNGRHELVDGQQRITTLMILFNVIAKTFPEINSESNDVLSGNLEAINRMIYFDSKNNRLCLQVDPNYNTDFDQTIIKAKNYDDLLYPSQANLKKDIPKYKFINTAKYFYDRLNALNDTEGEKVLGDFIKYILYKTNIIKITCTNESFAIKLFLVLNDRGMDLSPSDIVKSYILDRYSPSDQDYEYKCSVFNSNWKKIEQQCADNDIKIDDFIVFYEYYKLMKNPKRQVTEELRDIIKKEPEIDNLVNELRVFSNNVEQVYKSTDPVIYSLRYLPWQSYVITALACAFQVDYEKKNELFSSMQRFFYISWVGGKTLNGIKQTSFNLIAAIVKKEPIDKINGILESFIREKHLVRDFYEALDGDVYGYGFLKPLLLSVEYSIREETNTNFFKADKNIHLDHILPQNFDKRFRNEWSYIKDEDIEKTKLSIGKLGNMALLLGKKNEEALNHGMEKKIKIYSGEDRNSTGKTAFDTTKVVVEGYISGNTEWTVDSIKNRQVYLMNLIENLLSVSRDEIKLEPIISSENVGNGKWYYNDQYHTNRSLITNLIIDYVQKERFTNVDEIPEMVKNFKMQSHEVIRNTPLDGFDYDEIEINGLRMYIRTVCTTPDTLRFLSIMHQYYEFEAAKTSDDSKE